MIRASDYAGITGSTRKEKSEYPHRPTRKIKPVYIQASFTFFRSINLLIRQLLYRLSLSGECYARGEQKPFGRAISSNSGERTGSVRKSISYKS